MFSNVSISIVYILMVMFAILAIFILTDKGKLFDFKSGNIKNSLFLYLEGQFTIASMVFLIYKALNGGGHICLVIYFLSLANFAMVLHKYKQETHGDILSAVFTIFLVFILMIPLFFAAPHI
ncbi:MULTISPECIES: hypothetical protein [Acidithiobacillus]|uniref:hypothetical protein n=1 Tax=Acidithiobacillus ferrivorans TaxID=160808 RepID=UPI001C07AC7C|nr:hypothetical protein [Acidithiobacillus ferrivorans]MBU2851163.1 hypothetical protein [Acidithiobacillus ferrivorans]